MKKINEMTDAELQERIDFLKEIDSPSTAELCAELWNEKIAREKARKEREEKEKAEREAKRKAEEERKHQEEQAIAEKNKKDKKELLRKQHNILGKYFKLGDGDVYYKVVGVVGNQVVLECVCKYQAGTYSSSYTTHFTRSIDSLLENGVEVTEEEYLEQAGKSINLTAATKDLYDGAVDLYNDVMKDFNKVWRTWF